MFVYLLNLYTYLQTRQQTRQRIMNTQHEQFLIRFDIFEKLSAINDINKNPGTCYVSSMIKKFGLFYEVMEAIYNNMWLLDTESFKLASLDRLEYLRDCKELNRLTNGKGIYIYKKYYDSFSNKIKLVEFKEKMCAKKIQNAWKKYMYEPRDTMIVEENGELIEINIIRDAERSWRLFQQEQC